MKQDFFTRLLQSYHKNPKKFQILLAVVVGIPLLLFSYTYFYQKPKEEKAMLAISPLQYEFGKNDTSSAHYQNILNGESGKYRGALYLAENFSGTKSGELAKFYAGFAYYRLANYDKAIAMLEGCSIDEVLTESRVLATLGDAYAEKGNYEKAATFYEKAAEVVGNNMLYAPVYLLRAGLLFTLSKKMDKAEGVYEKALATFPHEISSEITSGVMPDIFEEIKRNLATVRTSQK